MQNSQQHVFFRNHFGDILISWMRTAMDDTVHVQVQMIKFGQQGIVGHNLVNLRITLGNPSVKLEISR